MNVIVALTIALPALFIGATAMADDKAVEAVLHQSTVVAAGYFLEPPSDGLITETGSIRYSSRFQPDAVLLGRCPTNDFEIAIRHHYLEPADSLTISPQNRYIVFLKSSSSSPLLTNADNSFWFLKWNSVVAHQVEHWKTIHAANNAMEHTEVPRHDGCGTK